jgi:hypothetical protein
MLTPFVFAVWSFWRAYEAAPGDDRCEVTGRRLGIETKEVEGTCFAFQRGEWRRLY